MRWLPLLAALALLAPASALAAPVRSNGGIEASNNTSRPSTQPRARRPKRFRLWIRIGRCEQPGRGYMGVNWSHPGPTYQGGLGFWYGTWDSFKPRGFPADAGQATWRQQMQVANRIYARYGTSPWGCA